MKFHTIDNVLKNQQLDERQKVEIKATLTRSRYSRLSYEPGDDVDALVDELARARIEKQQASERAEAERRADDDADRLPFVQLDANLLRSARLRGLLNDDDNDDVGAAKLDAELAKDDDGELENSPFGQLRKQQSSIKEVASLNSLIISSAESQVRNAYKQQHQNDIIRNKLLGKKTDLDELLTNEPAAEKRLINFKSPDALRTVTKALTSPPPASGAVGNLKELLTEIKFTYEPKNKKKEANELREAARLKEEREAQALVEKIRLQKEHEERLVAQAAAEKARLAREEQERLERAERERREKELRLKMEAEERLRREREAAERVQREKEEQQRQEKAARDQAERERLAKEQADQEAKDRQARLEADKLQQQRVKRLQEIEAALAEAKKALEAASKVPEEAANVAALQAQMLELDKARVNPSVAADSAMQKLRELVAKTTQACQERATKQTPKAGTARSVDENDRKGINQLTLASYYEPYRQLFDKYRHEAETALSDASLKMYKFDLQKAINFPVNSMLEDNDSEENRRNFDEKIKTIVRLLSGQTCSITSTLTVNPSKHPRAIDFCLVYLARKLVEKSEETVASRPETAFQYCRMVTEVCRAVGHFEKIMFGQFQDKCPYVVPYYKPRQPGQTLLQYQESIGYKITDGKAEDEIQYFRRMNGVMHFYFTMLASQPTNQAPGAADSYLFNNNGLKRAWQWLSDVLNLTPRANITADMLVVYFKCCGHQMQRAYGAQFLKLVQVCFAEYVPLIKAIPAEQQTGAYVGRLDAVYEQLKRTGSFPEWKRAV